jgi:hypothetical protein
VDAAVFLSYAAIPPLVLAVLAASRRFTWRDFALDTLAVTAAKFGVTYVAAAVLWATSGPPPPPPYVSPTRFPPAPGEPARPLPPETVSMHGVVLADGVPRGGAVVWVGHGVEGWAHPQRTEAVEVADDGRGFVPPVAAVQVGQPLRLRSTDGRLHAIRGTDRRGRTVFNVAVPAEPVVVRLHEAAGVVVLGCSVHDHRGKERPGRLVVAAHPHFAITGADGRFRLEGLPGGSVVLRVLDAELGEAEATVDLPSPEPVTLALGAPPAAAPR